MAYTSREFEVPASTVFAVLIDPKTYPRWLVGTQHIRDIDPDWPLVGNHFRHRVGFGPLTIPDSTEVLAIEPNASLQLGVRARPLISAVVDFRLVDDDGRCVLSMQEEPKVRLVGNVVRMVIDPLTHIRNHLSLKRLAALIEARSVDDPLRRGAG